MGTLEDWGVPLAVLGMLIATLFMAAVVKRYQAHQALVEAQIQRLELGIGSIVEGLAALHGVPLSRELRVTLRTEVLARYQRIARLFRRYPDIAQRLREAGAAISAEGAPPNTGVGPIVDQQAFRRVAAAIDGILDLMHRGDTLQPVPRDVRQIFCRELGERRAEAHARFHLTQARQYQRDGNLSRARAHVTTLLQVLKRRGPSTDFVRELYAETEHALQALSASQFGAPAPPVAAAENAEVMDSA